MRLKQSKFSYWPFAAHVFDVGPKLRLAAREESLHTALGCVAYAVIYFFAYRSGMSFSQVAASPFWFPDSVLLCALLISRPALWPVFILLALPIRLFADVSQGISQWFLLTTYAIDSAKCVFAALALRRVIGPAFHLETVRDLLAFFLFAVFLVPAAAAFLGAAARNVLGYDYWLSWEQWFLGNALAQMVVTPVILCWGFAETPAFEQSRRERKKVEMLFAHLKRILRLDRLRLRGPRGARTEFLLAATVQNLRKLAKLIPVPAT